MTNEHDSGSDKTPSFGAFIGSKSEGSSSPDNSKSSSSAATSSRRSSGRSRSTSAKKRSSRRATPDGDDTPVTADREPSSSEDRPASGRGSRSRKRTDEPSEASSSREPEGGEDSSPAGEQDRPRTRRRGSRGGARRRGKAAEEASEAPEQAEAPASRTDADERGASNDDDDDSGTGTTRKKRGRRGRRGRRDDDSSSREAEGSGQDEQPRLAEPEADESEAGGRKKRSRRKRSTRRTESTTRSESTTSGAEGESTRGEGEEESQEGAKRRRRGTRGGKKRGKKTAASSRRAAAALVEVIPGEEDDLPELPELPEDAELLSEGEAEKPRRKSRGRRKKVSDEADEDTDEEAPRSERGRKKEIVPDRQILVNAADREETRVAVVKDQRILDFQMNVESDKSLVNDIYRGRVVNLEESIGAAFIDFGRGRNGFLHTSDVLPAYGEKGWDLSKLLSARIDADEWDENSSQPHIADELDDVEGDGDSSGEDEDGEKKGDRRQKGRSRKGGGRSQRRRPRPRKPIKEMLRVGDRVVVQVTKDAIGDKGPTLTTYISIPGRYHVLMPSTNHRGVSRKIEDVRERRRLKKILDGLDIPDGMGVIARTAAKGSTKVELKRDLDYLLDAWNRLSKRITSGHGPLALYQESDVAIRTVRDLFGPQTESVVVDEPKTFQRVKEFAELLMPEHVDRIKLHEGDRPLFHSAGIEQEFERIFSRRIELPSGGSIVFDQAEALVAIDVNSGKTRTSSHDFEEIALKTNMEAVPEIARQIRLRDLGGILVVDFIDMMKNSNRRAVEKAFRDQLAMDRARSKLGRISQFGLLEMTRQRLGPGMSKKLFTNCPACRGMGRVRTPVSRAAGILRRLGSAMTLKGFSTIEVRAHADALDYLKKEHKDELEALQKKHNRTLQLTPAPDQLEDSVLRYLRADGREVRPGGRRKR